MRIIQIPNIRYTYLNKCTRRSLEPRSTFTIWGSSIAVGHNLLGPWAGWVAWADAGQLSGVSALTGPHVPRSGPVLPVLGPLCPEPTLYCPYPIKLWADWAPWTWISCHTTWIVPPHLDCASQHLDWALHTHIWLCTAWIGPRAPGSALCTCIQSHATQIRPHVPRILSYCPTAVLAPHTRSSMQATLPSPTHSLWNQKFDSWGMASNVTTDSCLLNC